MTVIARLMPVSTPASAKGSAIILDVNNHAANPCDAAFDPKEGVPARHSPLLAASMTRNPTT